MLAHSTLFDSTHLVNKDAYFSNLKASYNYDTAKIQSDVYGRCPRFQERCHPFDPSIRGLEGMTNASLQRGR